MFGLAPIQKVADRNVFVSSSFRVFTSAEVTAKYGKAPMQKDKVRKGAEDGAVYVLCLRVDASVLAKNGTTLTRQHASRRLFSLLLVKRRNNTNASDFSPRR